MNYFCKTTIATRVLMLVGACIATGGRGRF